MATLLQSADLSWMQTVQNTALPDTCTIYRATMTADGMGGFSEQWLSVLHSIPCRLYPVNSRAMSEYETGGQWASVTRWFLTLEHGTTVTAKDVAYVDGRTFQISEVNTSESWKTVVRCEVQAIDVANLIDLFDAVFEFDIRTDSQYIALL